MTDSPSSGTDRRIATEIKLYRALNAANYDFYRSVTPLSDGAYQELADSRAWSWKLLFVTEIACVFPPFSTLPVKLETETE